MPRGKRQSQQYEEFGPRLNALNGGGIEPPLLARYGEARLAYEHALTEYDKVIGPALTEDQMHEFETARTEYVVGS